MRPENLLIFAKLESALSVGTLGGSKREGLHRIYFHSCGNPNGGNHDINEQDNTGNGQPELLNSAFIRHNHRESIDNDLKLRVNLKCTNQRATLKYIFLVDCT